MDFFPLRLGPLYLEAPTDWGFFPFDGLILGRPDDRSASLQITTAYAEPHPHFEHKDCLAAAREFSDWDGYEATNIEVAEGWFGRLAATDASATKVVWYRFANQHLLLAVFDTTQPSLELVDQQLRVAEKIAQSMRFDDSRVSQ